MGSDRKSKRSYSSSQSESEDEKKSKRKRRVDDDDDDEERKNRKREKKEKRKDKKHSSSSSRDNKSHKKEKKSKDKHKSKRSKGEGNVVDFQELSSDDYFAKNNEFATWLKEEKNVFFSDLLSESARELFAEFVKAWNRGKLESNYYEGIATAPRTAHNWKIKK